MSDSTTVTQKGQVTIPAEFRQRLGIRPGDRLRFEMSDGRLTIKREPSLDEVRGAAGKLDRRMSWLEMRRIARDERAQRRKSPRR